MQQVEQFLQLKHSLQQKEAASLRFSWETRVRMLSHESVVFVATPGLVRRRHTERGESVSASAWPLLAPALSSRFLPEPWSPASAPIQDTSSYNTQLKLITTLHYTHLTASSRTNRVSRYQRGKTVLDLNKARDDGVLGASSAGPYANNLHLSTDR